MSIRTVGIMGSGGHMVDGHLPFLNGARVVGIFDPEIASTQAAAKALGYMPVTYFTPEALLNIRPDCILIGSPEQFHAQQLAMTVAAGIPVLCDKPLAIDSMGLELVKKALQDAKTQRLLVASCHQRRTAPSDLAYGWVLTNLRRLEKRFGRLKRIGLNSNYPHPMRSWKQHRSFLADKFVHDIDYMRALLGNGHFEANRMFDAHDHYLVTGHMMYGKARVDFTCEGTRLHGDRASFVEYIMLNFERGDCVVYAKSGVIRYHDRRTNASSEEQITPMVPRSYDRQNHEVMRCFLSGQAVHTPEDLLVNTESVVTLAGPRARYIGG